ncbi:uncharacterized protein LOC133442229 isoform X2 [Cololabis saira]|nr:uncharacterized protein LOC133442229 isoform X2 [Cololabis saira]
MLLKLKKLSIRKEVKKVFTRKKLSQPMTPIPLATGVECRTLRDHLNANNPVTFRITARDTQARAVYAHNRTGGNPDVTMCANITVDRVGPANIVLQHTGAEQTSHNERFFARPSAGCRMSKGDSGSGFIYNNALYAVFKGVKIWYIGTSVIDRENIAFTICDTDIRRWIDQTMRARF